MLDLFNLAKIWREEGGMSFVLHLMLAMVIVMMVLLTICVPIDLVGLSLKTTKTVIERKESVFHPAKSGSHMIGKAAHAYSRPARTEYFFHFQIDERDIKTEVEESLFNRVKEFDAVEIVYGEGRITGKKFVKFINPKR